MKVLSSFTILLLVASLMLTIASSPFFMVNAQISEVQRVLSEREDNLERLVKKAETLEKQRCSRLSSWNAASQGCLISACGNTFPASEGFGCQSDLGKYPDTCGDDCPGAIRSKNKSTVLFASDTDNTDAQIQSFLSYSSQYEDQLEQERTNGMAAWSGIASFAGVSYWFPGFIRERESTCSGYDPRTRSWYTAASSGPKDVVIVADVSGSMSIADCNGCPSRLNLMKDAAKNLLSSFTLNDYFAIATFSTSGKIITSNGQAKLLQGSSSNKAAAENAIDDLFADGVTNFAQGFQQAYNIFSQSTESTSGCGRIILFLTDGIATDKDTIDTYLSNQQSSSTFSSNKPYIMTFTMSSGADQVIPKRIACAHTGIHSHIANGVNPYSALSQFYRFLAGGLNSSRPVWTEFYIDAFGLGKMTTVARPFYDRSQGDLFAGVVEIDVPANELLQYSTENEVTLELTNRGSTCPTYNITSCYLQFLRSEASGECPSPEPSVSDCRATNSLNELATCTSRSGGINSMMCEAVNFNTLVATSGAKSFKDVVCCEGCDTGLAPAAIAGIAVGAVAGVAVIGGVIYLVAFKGAAGAAAGGGASSAAATAGATGTGGGGASTVTTSYPTYGHQSAPNGAPQHSYPNQAFGQPVYGQAVPQGYGGGRV